MDARKRKLMIYSGLPEDVVDKLMEAGLTTPRKIKSTTDKALEKMQGVGKATRILIREKVG